MVCVLESKQGVHGVPFARRWAARPFEDAMVKNLVIADIDEADRVLRGARIGDEVVN